VTKQKIVLVCLLLMSLTTSTLLFVFPPVKAEQKKCTLTEGTTTVSSTIQATIDAANIGESTTVEYVLSISVNGQGSTSPAVGSHYYENGSEIAVTAIDTHSLYGFLFEYWILDGSTIIHKKNHNPLYLLMDRNHELTAVFLRAPNTYPTFTSSPSPTPEPTSTPKPPTPTPSPEIPELTPWLILPPFMIATMLSAIFCFKKAKR
jgi:hypothetical protein